MRVHRMEKRIALETAGGPCRIEVRLRSVAVDDVVSRIARVRGICNAELGMIEDVEGLGTKLEIQAFR